MRSQLLASLTSKLVAGVAATTLAAGSAGAVAMTTINSDSDGTQEVAEQVLDGSDVAVDCDASDDSLQAFEEEIDTDTADGGEVVEDPCDDESTDEDGEDEGADEGADDGEDPEGTDDGEDADAAVTLEDAVACAGDLADSATFGGYVKKLRHECGYHGGVSELAHEKNRLRKEAKAAEEETQDEAEAPVDEVDEVDDAADEAADDAEESEEAEEEADEESDEEADEVTTESTDAPGAHGKGHAKKK